MATWPPQWGHAADRTLGWLDLRTLEIVDENGEIFRAADVDHLLALCVDRNLLLFFRGALAHSQLFPVGLREGWLTYSERLGGVAGVRAKVGRNVRWILSADCWQLHGPEDLAAIRWLWDTAEAPGYSTPAAVGQALMRRHYSGRRLRPPPLAAFDVLKGELSGGRSDLFFPGEYDEIYEEDLNSAYAAAIRHVPSGKPFRFTGYPPEGAFWVGLADWSPSLDGWPGVLPFREKGVTGWPVSGDHQSVITSIEAELASGHGYRIKTRNGWAWSDWTDGFSPWTDAMFDLRSQAPDELTKVLAKQATVAAIGRFYGSRYSWAVKPLSALGEASEWGQIRGIPDMSRWPAEGAALPAVAMASESESCELLPQITAFVMAQVRVWLWERMHAAGRENVIASNYDAVYLREPSGLPLGLEPGEWKQSRHEHANLPARRWLQADDVDKRPGVPKEGRIA